MSKKEIHDAIVTRNIEADRASTLLLRGAVYFNSRTLFDGEYPIPAVPCFQFASETGAGIFFVPKVGDQIEIEIETHDSTSDTTHVEVPEPRWRCMIYSNAADIAEEFKVNYPFRMGWKSNSGHILLFDDLDGVRKISLLSRFGHEIVLDDLSGKEKIELRSSGGHKVVLDDQDGIPQIQLISKGGHAIVLDDSEGNETVNIIHRSGALIQIVENGSINIIDSKGQTIFLNTVDEEVSIIQKDGASFKMDGDEISMVDATGGQILVLNDDSINMQADKEMAISTTNMSINAAFTAIGGLFAIFSAVLGENNSAYLTTHFHLSGAPGTPSTPPVISPFIFTGTPLDTNALFIKLRGNF